MTDFITGEVTLTEPMIHGRSSSIGALAAALAKAQGEMAGAVKDKTNPHFKSAYADLASVWDACRAALSKHGLAVMQPVSAEGPTVTVTTILTHSSGEWLSGNLAMTAQQNTPQGIGSCITYARRYSLASMVGVAPEDDDGNAASQPAQGVRAQQIADSMVTKAPAGYDDWLEDLAAVADNGAEALKQTWTKSKPEYRRHLTTTNNAGWNALKAKAANVEPVTA